MLSTKNLVFKDILTKKLIDKYVSPYIIEESSVFQYSQIKTADFNEDLSSSEC